LALFLMFQLGQALGVADGVGAVIV
jgi:hypothetical protein